MAHFKRRLGHLWHKFLGLNPLYFVVVGVIFGVVCIVALRQNNIHMEQLKKAVYSADKNNGNVQQALDNLQAYVIANMNTNLSTGTGSVYPPIQLEYTYQRLAKAQEQAVLNDNKGLYTAAEDYCQSLDPNYFSGRTRVPCVENYITTHGVKIPKIPTALYEFDFISPTWSPDLAGWTLLASVFFLVLAAGLYINQFVVKYLINNNL
jgi:hypothetical protein